MNIMTDLTAALAADWRYPAILLVTFFAVFLLVTGGGWLINRRDRLAQRLATLHGSERAAPGRADHPALVDEQPRGLAARLSRPLSRGKPADPATRSGSTRQRLLQAGLRSRKAYANFLAAKLLCGLALPGLGLVNLAFYTPNLSVLPIMAALAVAGFFLPDLVILVMRRRRQASLTRALPDALDLLVVCVEAGLGLDMAFKRVGEEIRPLSRELSDEFLLTNLEVRSGQSRQESYRNMALRTGVPDISQLMAMLNQTSRFGTSLASALRIHSEAMRVKRRQTAEEIAAKASIKLLFPLVLFIFPALFVVLLGPSVIQILRLLLPTVQGG